MGLKCAKIFANAATYAPVFIDICHCRQNINRVLRQNNPGPIRRGNSLDDGLVKMLR